VSAALAEGGAARVAVVIVACGLVLAAEGMNTALERAIDRVGRERHPLAGAAKDSAAGAVLVAALAAAAVGGVLLLPHVAACWQAFARASAPAKALWLAALATFVGGVLAPEGKLPQGRG
jgi:hypothetical protein